MQDSNLRSPAPETDALPLGQLAALCVKSFRKMAHEKGRFRASFHPNIRTAIYMSMKVCMDIVVCRYQPRLQVGVVFLFVLRVTTMRDNKQIHEILSRTPRWTMSFRKKQTTP